MTGKTAAMLVRAVSEIALDILIRTSILEGLAGVRPGTWGRLGTRGLDLAAKALPHLPPEWTAREDQGLYRGLLKTVSSKLPRERADDLVQEILSGLTRNVPGGELYDIGKAQARERHPSLKSAQRWLLRHGWQRAHAKSRSDSRIEEVDLEAIPAPEETGSDDILDFLLFTERGEQFADGFWEVLLPELTPGVRKVIETVLDHPDATNTAIGRMLGVTPTHITHSRGKAVNKAREILTERPDLLEHAPEARVFPPAPEQLKHVMFPAGRNWQG